MNKFGFGERGEGIDLVVECSGAEVCVQTGIYLAKRRGTYVQVGAGPANNLIPMSILVNKEIKLIGSLRVRNLRVSVPRRQHNAALTNSEVRPWVVRVGSRPCSAGADKPEATHNPPVSLHLRVLLKVSFPLHFVFQKEKLEIKTRNRNKNN